MNYLIKYTYSLNIVFLIYFKYNNRTVLIIETLFFKFLRWERFLQHIAKPYLKVSNDFIVYHTICLLIYLVQNNQEK